MSNSLITLYMCMYMYMYSAHLSKSQLFADTLLVIVH